MKMNQLLSLDLPAVKEYEVINAKGEALVTSPEGLYTFDWKKLQFTMKPFNFSIAKTKRAAFVDAIRGEFFARELAKLEADAKRFSENDSTFFSEAEAPAEAEKAYSAEEIAEARENMDEALKRIDVVRAILAPLAKEAESTTIKSIVFAMRPKDVLPATLAKEAESVTKEAKALCEAAAKKYSAAEAETARAILADEEGHGVADIENARAIIAAFELSEGMIQGVPNMKRLRDLITKFIKAMWKPAPTEGVEKFNFECSHSLSVEVFQRIRKARALTKKGNVRSGFVTSDDIAREVIFAVLEALQAKARAEAAEAEAKKKAAAKPAPEAPKK